MLGQMKLNLHFHLKMCQFQTVISELAEVFLCGRISLKFNFSN